MNIRMPISAGLVILLLFSACSKSSEQNSQEKDDYYNSITETGELQAVNSTMITVPFYGWEYGRAKLIWLEKEGEMVREGDLVALLDTSSVKRVKTQKQSDLEQLDNLQIQLNKLDTDTRELIMLRYYSQLSFMELSKMRSEPIGSTLAKVHRGLKKLRELMEQ